MANKRLDSLETDFFSTIGDRLKNMEISEKPLLNLSIGIPDGRAPQRVLETVKKSVDEIENHKYAGFGARDSFVEAIINFYKRHYDVDLKSENVAVLYGSKNGIITFPSIFMEPGEHAFLPNPGYTDYVPGVKLADGKMYELPLLAENNFLPNYDELNQNDLDDARLLYLNYPSNPLGTMASKEFFDDTIERFKGMKTKIIHDFAYAAFGFEEKAPSILQSDKNLETSMEIYSLSKGFNMSGFRVGFAVGNAEMIDALNRYQSYSQAGMFGVLQEAATTALNECDDFLLTQNKIFKQRRDKFTTHLREAGIPLNNIEGGMFGWIETPEGFNGEEFFEYLLKEQSILVTPGSPFGSRGENKIRVSLAIEDSELDECINRFLEIKNLWK